VLAIEGPGPSMTRFAIPSPAPRMMLIRRTMPRGVIRCRLIVTNCFRSAALK